MLVDTTDETTSQQMDAAQAKIEEEIATKNRALELAETEAAVSQTVAPDLGTSNLVATTEKENSMLVDTTDETTSQQMDAAQKQAELSPKHGMDIDAVDENTTSAMVDQTMPDHVKETSLTSETHGEPVRNDEGFDSAGSVQFSCRDENPATVKSAETFSRQK
ncbi:putative cell division cycle 5-like protein [Abeliophyllum distichum]|uniref:Cell division cycle 5-like protein n=1 Tax=Abeliophyllum distichum TaxID=126358 RepID=A0ABD1VVW4_9LAMI